jgi:hypothetical protein
MAPTQSKHTLHRRGDITFLLDIVQAILPTTVCDWYEVAEVYNSGVSPAHSCTAITLRSEFRMVFLLFLFTF